MRQGKNRKNEGDLALKHSNVATFRATSRRSREDICKRRAVKGNVATFQRILINNVATLDINVATFQRLLKTNVATFHTHVVMF